jgi:hypothetical protein
MALRRLRYVRLRVPNIKGPAFFKTPAVGLDIDRAAIKAVQGSRSPWSFALQHVGYRKLPAGAESDLGLPRVQGQGGVPRGSQPNSNEESANQVSLGQNEEELDSGDAESSAPGVENCDTDSYSAFESKDPFRLLKGIESKDGEDGGSKSGEAKNRDGKADNGKASVIGAGGGAAGNNGDDARDSRDSIDQPLPGGPDFMASQSGNGNLFSGGEDLPAP